MGSYDPLAYAWLDHEADGPGPYLIQASCFSFVSGVDLDEVVRRSGLSNVEWKDLSNDDDPFAQVEQNTVAAFASDAWTVLYQDNGYPDQIATTLCSAEDVPRAVVVFWNVNAVVEFAYWENGALVAGFTDFVAERIGADPQRLKDDLRAFGLTGDDPEAEYSHEQYRRMLALAEHLTGVRIAPDFLRRSRVALGTVED
jgi:Family of unknown function (DUF6461)